MLLGLAVVLVAPSLASAQLFPDLPIRRKRVDCSQENPQYKVIRQEYWGYYPTTWRKFPEGSHVPSPEGPDWAKAIDPARGGLPLVKFDDKPSRKPEVPPANGRNGANPADDGAVRPKTNDADMPKPPPDTDDPFDPKPRKPAGVDPKGVRDPFTDPPADAPKGPATTDPAPLGDPPTATAAPTPARRRSLVAGLFGRRN